MSSSARYRINSPSVINETIEGESVIINLETGFYYSLANIGSTIWDAIDKRISVEDIAAQLSKKYTIQKEEIEATVNELVSELKKENLIVPLGEGEHTSSEALSQFSENLPGEFAEPALQKFGDMQDLLLLDPIHEVDEAGWPHSKPQNPPEE